MKSVQTVSAIKNSSVRLAKAAAVFAATVAFSLTLFAPTAALADEWAYDPSFDDGIEELEPEASSPIPSVDHVWALASKKGFNPSKNNYLPIRAVVSSSIDENFDWFSSWSGKVELYILNSKGQWVFKKNFGSMLYFDDRASISYKWNGKASKNNEAKVKPGSYVKKSGTYKAQIRITFTSKETNASAHASKNASFKISSKAKKGTAGYAQAKKLPIYTGDPTTDYLIERMLKKAGVKSSNSQDKKVRKIYHYISMKFRVTNIGRKYKGSNDFTNIKSSSFKAAAAKYGKKVQSKADAGTIMIGDYYMRPEALNARAGDCGYFAAVFQLMCQHVGVDATCHYGWYKNSSKELLSHTWSSAIVNGKRYYYDADVEAINKGNGQGDYYWYKMTLKQSKKVHKYAK